MKIRFVILLAALVLGACQGGSSAYVRDEARADRFTQLEGASIVLNQELIVTAGKARVFFQNGEVSQGFDSYQPHCSFEIRSVMHDGFTINADSFVVTQVQRSTQPVVSRRPAQVAALFLVGGLGDGGSQSYYDGYHFWVTSANQPDVRRMSCFGVYAQPYELYPPTLREIRQALGSVAEIRQ